MMRRTATWLATLGGAALLLAACSSSTASTAPSSVAGPSAAPSVAAPSVAASVATASEPLPSAATSSAEPSLAIPSFELPSDEKGLEALLPNELCGKTALKVSVGGDRFASMATPELTQTLAKLGKTDKDVAFAIATAGPSAADCNSNAAVFQIKGADAGQFRDVFLAAAQAADQTTYTQGNVGGKAVYIIGGGPAGDTKTYAYFKGDGLFFVNAKDDAAAAPLLQAMP